MRVVAMIRLWLLVGIATASFVGGWSVNGWRHEAKMSSLISEYTQAATKAQEEAQAYADDMKTRYDKADAQRYKELNDAQKENDALRNAVNAGSVRLRVNAKCPSPNGVSTATNATSMGNDSAPRLEGDAERNYFALRTQVETMEKQLLWCQDAFNSNSR